MGCKRLLHHPSPSPPLLPVVKQLPSDDISAGSHAGEHQQLVLRGGILHDDIHGEIHQLEVGRGAVCVQHAHKPLLCCSCEVVGLTMPVKLEGRLAMDIDTIML